MKTLALPLLVFAALASSVTLSAASSSYCTSDSNCAHPCTAGYSISELDSPPRPNRQTLPVYPAELRAAKISGEALICLVVDESGQTRDVQCLRETAPGFGDAAIAAVQQWRFDPGVKDGRAVPCRLEVPIVFSLRN